MRAPLFFVRLAANTTDEQTNERTGGYAPFARSFRSPCSFRSFVRSVRSGELRALRTERVVRGRCPLKGRFKGCSRYALKGCWRVGRATR